MPSASGGSLIRMIWLPATKAVKEELAADETVGHYLPPSVRPAQIRQHPGPIEAKPEKCVGCKSCMKARLSGHQRDGREKCRSTTPSAQAAACAASCAIKGALGE